MSDKEEVNTNPSSVPGATVSDQPLEEALASQSPSSNSPGFKAAAPSKPKVPMKTFDYESPHFDITARVAPNNTIDFVFKHKLGVEDASDAQFAFINKAVQFWYIEAQKYQNNTLDPETPKISDLQTAPVENWPYTLSINLKPLMTYETSMLDEAQPGSIHALVQLNFNRPGMEDAGSSLRGYRVNREIDATFFKSCYILFSEAYKNKNPHITTPFNLTDVRADFLGYDKPSPGVATAAPRQRREGDITSNETTPKYPPYVRQDSERRGAPPENGMADLQRQVRLAGQMNYERHQELTAQLRTVQSQQTMILDQQQEMLDDNKTLFTLMNLLAKALGVAK